MKEGRKEEGKEGEGRKEGPSYTRAVLEGRKERRTDGWKDRRKEGRKDGKNVKRSILPSFLDVLP